MRSVYKKKLAIIFCAFLGACAANPAAYREKSPTYELYSSLAPSEVAVCYSDMFDSKPYHRMPVMLKRTKNGFTVQRWYYWEILMVIPMGHRNSILIDVEESDIGSRIKVYEEYGFLGGTPSGQKIYGQCL